VTLAVMYSGLELFQQTSVQDIAGSLFMLSTEMIFTFSYGVTYVFPSALPIMRREVGEGTYSMSAYYVASVISFIPIAFFKSYVFFSVVFLSIYYTRGFLLYISMGFILSLSAVAATAYGLFLSSLFETDKMASECAAPFDLIFLIFGGAYLNVNSIPFLKYISIFFYANEGLMFDFWKDVDNIGKLERHIDFVCKSANLLFSFSLSREFRASLCDEWYGGFGSSLLQYSQIYILDRLLRLSWYIHRFQYYNILFN